MFCYNFINKTLLKIQIPILYLAVEIQNIEIIKLLLSCSNIDINQQYNFYQIILIEFY